MILSLQKRWQISLTFLYRMLSEPFIVHMLPQQALRTIFPPLQVI